MAQTAKLPKLKLGYSSLAYKALNALRPVIQRLKRESNDVCSSCYEVHITPILKQFATSAAIAFFRAVRGVKRGLQHTLAGLGRFLAPIGRLAVDWIILPAYRTAITAQLKFQRTVLPSRGVFLFFASNRYLFHAVLTLATIATVVMNIQARQAFAQDVGQNSLLYALATDSDVEIVQETAREEDGAAVPRDSYIVKGTLMAVPHIDFDYDDEHDPTLAALSVPGAISAPIVSDTENEASRAPRTRTETYVVKDGDTIGSIARSFNVNVGTILWSNNLTERQYIRPGDSLKIPPVSGVLVTVKKGDTIAKLAARYDGDVNEIRDMNRITDETTLALGTELVIPGGRPPAPEQTLIAIASRSREQSASRTGTAANTNTKRPADIDTEDLPSARLLWPTSGHVITQYYGWRHTGVDIDGDFSSPLYASYEGVVSAAGWNSGGYGLQVVIKHPNGMMTRYAHSSKLFVKVGDAVKRGQVIAMMGSTGRSTGSHLHFEVYVNGKRANPLAYIK
jgi:murein DD-endopeptidase MepM/ murein hydrolase activator NlpD